MGDAKHYVSLKELFEKEVINVSNGDRLGYIDDGEFDAECGEIKNFSIGASCKNLLSKNKEVQRFAFGDIVKIGKDTVLIKNCYCVVKNKTEKGKKYCK